MRHAPSAQFQGTVYPEIPRVVSFDWVNLGNGVPPVPGLTVTVTGRKREVISGIYDTGASVTNLDVSWRKRLGVKMTQCVPRDTELTTGIQVSGLLTMVDATLDGHTFRMPVLFVQDNAESLFGRVGIIDQFMIQLDPRTHRTHFAWAGPTDWAKQIEDDWRQRLHGQRGQPKPLK
jgi:hypothetical protein